MWLEIYWHYTVLDAKSNLKTQIEKLASHQYKPSGILFKLKHEANVSVLRSVLLCFIPVYLLNIYLGKNQ